MPASTTCTPNPRGKQLAARPAKVMGSKALSLVAVGASAIILSGCMSSGGNTVRPLTPVPTTAVSSAPLAQPISVSPQVGVESQTLDEAAGIDSATDDPLAETETAALPTTTPPGQAASSGAEVSEDDLIGAWSASTPSATCSINLSLTNWTGGYRASTRNCGDVQLATLSAWDVQGQQVLLKGTDGAPLARLFRTGGTRYSGQLESGQTVTVFR